jgi:uncharacterized BrkB/YihY/UPF0761 family membrane protein
MADDLGSEPGAPGSDEEGTDKRTVRERIADVRVRAEELRSEAQARLDEERGRRTWVETAYEAWDMDRQRGGPLLAGGLAYRIFLWMLPFALLLATLAALVAEASGRTTEELARDVGLAGAIVGMVGEAAQDAGSSSWWLLLLGIALSLWAARGLARALMVTSRIAWALPPRTARVTTKAALAVWGLFVAGLSIQWLRPFLFRGGMRSDLFAQVVIFGLSLAVIVVGMSLAPRRGPWTNVLAGAALLAVGLRGMAIGTSVYFLDALTEKGDLYGGLGIAIVILLYLFLCSRLFVWGQFLNARAGGVRLVDGVEVGDPAGAPRDPEGGAANPPR